MVNLQRVTEMKYKKCNNKNKYICNLAPIVGTKQNLSQLWLLFYYVYLNPMWAEILLFIYPFICTFHTKRMKCICMECTLIHEFKIRHYSSLPPLPPPPLLYSYLIYIYERYCNKKLEILKCFRSCIPNYSSRYWPLQWFLSIAPRFRPWTSE